MVIQRFLVAEQLVYIPLHFVISSTLQTGDNKDLLNPGRYKNTLRPRLQYMVVDQFWSNTKSVVDQPPIYTIKLMPCFWRLLMGSSFAWFHKILFYQFLISIKKWKWLQNEYMLPNSIESILSVADSLFCRKCSLGSVFGGTWYKTKTSRSNGKGSKI